MTVIRRSSTFKCCTCCSWIVDHLDTTVQNGLEWIVKRGMNADTNEKKYKTCHSTIRILIPKSAQDQSICLNIKEGHRRVRRSWFHEKKSA